MTTKKQKQILIMTKLAAYDKQYAAKDRKKAEYFRHDYVYRQNVATRLFVLIGSIIVAFFYFAHRVIIDGLDILNLDETLIDAIKAGIFIVLVQVVYTLIGFWTHARDYNTAQDRIAMYYKNMDKLKKILEPAAIKEDTPGRYEPDDDEYFKD